MNKLEWEVNELLPASDSIGIIAIGTCYKENEFGIGCLIAINTTFDSIRVADCLTCEQLHTPPEEANRIFELHKYDIRISHKDPTALIIRTPRGSFYLVKKKPSSETKIAWMQIRENTENDGGANIPPSRLSWN